MTPSPTYDHTAEAIFFAGIMWALIKWITRTVKDVEEDKIPPSNFTASITRLESGIAPHAAPRDLVTVTGAHAYAMHSAGPPVVAHCPACGFQLNAAPQPLPFVAACPNCKRQCSVRGDGPGRLSVVVSDTHSGAD